MFNFRRGIEHRRLLAKFYADYSTEASHWSFLFWCAAHNQDPRGFFSRLSSRLASLGPLANSLADDNSDPRGPGWTPLHEACYLGCPQAVEALTAACPQWVDARDARGVAPLRALFLFNDTAPGWKHPGTFDVSRSHRYLALDADVKRCATILLQAGAKHRGGEFCSAAYMGLPDTCATLSLFSHAHTDYIDHLFPQWASSRGFIHNPPDGCSMAVVCALEGNMPACALSIALGAPRSMDVAHITLFCRKALFSDSISFLSQRPECAQTVLEILCDQLNPPETEASRKEEIALVKMALSLGANALTRLDIRLSSFWSSPLSMAVRNARVELVELCLRSVPVSASLLIELVNQSEPGPFIGHQRRAAALALLEQPLLSLDISTEVNSAHPTQSNPKRL